MSLEAWIRKLEAELAAPHSEGSDFRLNRLVESANSTAERCVRRNANGAQKDVTSCVVIEDGNVGYMVLTAIGNEPQAVTLDAPEEGVLSEQEIADYMAFAGPEGELREAWQPPKEFWEPFDLYASLKTTHRSRVSWKEEIKLSPANLEILMSAHRVLAEHTEKLQVQVSELFNRCQRLQDEYRDQIHRTASLIPRVDAITGKDEEDGGDLYGSAVIEDRLEKVRDRQEALKARYQALRKKMATVSVTQLSEKEAQFVEELQTMEGSVDQTERRLTDDVDGSEVPVWQRVGKLKDTKEKLSKEAANAESRAGSEERPVSSVKVPSYSRKAEQEQIQAMLKHQTELLEATTNRLRDLGVTMPAVSTEGGS